MKSPLPPLSAYIHIPWCIKKCPYCDFNSHTAREIPEQAYVEALIQDFNTDAHLAFDRPLNSIFFGGGTPSLFRAKSIARILEAISQKLRFAEDIEITLEANPGATEYHNLAELKAAGVNRLSIGVQSFKSAHLQTLGRIHSSHEATAAYQAARDAGFENINLDLMHGLPKQTTAEALNDLQQAILLAPDHISWYQLTIEPNTVFYSSPPTLPKDIIAEAIFDQGLALLRQAGYAQYEVSAFSPMAKRSKHNLNYWQFGDYLGLGAGAHGKITHQDGEIRRYWKTRLPNDYLDKAKAFAAGSQSIEREQQTLEFLMNALRLTDGVPSEWLVERTSLELDTLHHALRSLRNKGLIEKTEGVIVTTELGFRFLNDVLAALD